ncbi:hypothetical protein [Bacillus paralicheniformis]|uniref:hypothetical protein n=1 Tax=Bacillus paralicheniformis TaxID=1648923 RepID=UPI002DBF9A89|nr:hypothetical protein [Bacillus paralicheniformis]MEC1022264.1 hypothetical protein [Bacillus paralicheniformis]MEC1027500.1 hypothetical protein [Bacillus paralicheniformis]MEC1066086.1 hypothetical protein [Bacillus paralicheniformis]MEC1084331.1 hypothetical protein [Bacillus paralicheniformis]MEC1100454.1 hypothetical protein [Bacillus paralicheniformis]
MDEGKKEQIHEHIRDLLKYKRMNSNQIFLESIRLFKLSNIRLCFLILMFMAAFIFLKFFLFNVTSAIDIISDITVNVNTIIIPVFTIIVTGYAIFQALANDQTMITLITVKHKEQSSIFKIYNLYFLGVGVFYLIIIILNFLVMIIFKYLPSNWYLIYLSIETNELISALLISLYITFIFNFLIELKSVIYNLFQVFITNAASNGINYLSEMKKEEKDN